MAARLHVLILSDAVHERNSICFYLALNNRIVILNMYGYDTSIEYRLASCASFFGVEVSLPSSQYASGVGVSCLNDSHLCDL